MAIGDVIKIVSTAEKVSKFASAADKLGKLGQIANVAGHAADALNAANVTKAEAKDFLAKTADVADKAGLVKTAKDNQFTVEVVKGSDITKVFGKSLEEITMGDFRTKIAAGDIDSL